MNIKRCLEILEIAPNVTYEEAKAAYRLMCQVWHPDKYSHSEQLHAKPAAPVTLMPVSHHMRTPP